MCVYIFVCAFVYKWILFACVHSCLLCMCASECICMYVCVGEWRFGVVVHGQDGLWLNDDHNVVQIGSNTNNMSSSCSDILS